MALLRVEVESLLCGDRHDADLWGDKRIVGDARQDAFHLVGWQIVALGACEVMNLVHEVRSGD